MTLVQHLGLPKQKQGGRLYPVCLTVGLLTMVSCRVMYDTGEVEELDLNEVIKDGHMSLLAA